MHFWQQKNRPSNIDRSVPQQDGNGQPGEEQVYHHSQADDEPEYRVALPEPCDQSCHDPTVQVSHIFWNVPSHFDICCGISILPAGCGNLDFNSITAREVVRVFHLSTIDERIAVVAEAPRRADNGFIGKAGR